MPATANGPVELAFEGSLVDLVASNEVAVIQTLSTYLPERRWFSAKDRTLKSAKIRYLTPLPGKDREVLLAEIETQSGDTNRWQLPISVMWDDEPQVALPHQLALARVRRGRRMGLLTDAFLLPSFAHRVVNAMADGLRIETREGSLVFEATPGAEVTLRRPESAGVLWITAEQSNSSLIVDDAVMLKIFRRVVPGTHPEAEMSRYLTLNGFANTPALLGELTRVTDKGQRNSLAVAQAFVRNQGDAWRWMLDQFNRALEDLSTNTDVSEQREDKLADYTAIAASIGTRLKEMHAVLGRPTDDPDFAPGAAAEDDTQAWLDRATELLNKAFAALKERASDDEAIAARAKLLLSRQKDLTAALRTLAQSGIGSPVTRVHGDFHLGQVLVAAGDVFIIDFEGEPGQPIDARRAKSNPLRDVAGLMRSIDYAAATTIDPKNVTAAALSAEDREAFLTRLRDSAQEAFLKAYFAGASRNDKLLDFFLIEKAAYELGYEVANRPAWVPIPLNGLLRIAERILRRPEKSS